jgi:acyl carrier protein
MVTVEMICDLVRAQWGGGTEEAGTLGAGTLLDDLGLSSLQVSDLVFTLEEQLGVEFDLAEAAEVTTVGALAEMLDAVTVTPAAP